MLRRFKWRGQRDIEKDILDGGCQDINSREELIELAEKEGLIGEVIRWDKWDKLVQDTKELIQQLAEREKVLKSTKLDTNYNGGKPVKKYVYDLNGKLLGIFSSSEEVAKHFDIERGAVNYYSWKKRPYWVKKLIILSEPMDETLKRSLDISA